MENTFALSLTPNSLMILTLQRTSTGARGSVDGRPGLPSIFTEPAFPLLRIEYVWSLRNWYVFTGGASASALICCRLS